jgi:hypothetical protein
VRAWDGEYEATISTAAGDFTDLGFADLQGRQGALCSGSAPNPVGMCQSGTTLVNVNDFGARFESTRDVDGDGIRDVDDNCPSNSNSGQENTDGSGDGGDACDSDDDNDGVADASDACPTTPAATANGCPGGGGAGGGRQWHYRRHGGGAEAR